MARETVGKEGEELSRHDTKAWTSDNPFAPGASAHQDMVYAIQHPFTGKMIYSSNGVCWRYQQDTMLEIMNGWTKYELKDLHDASASIAIIIFPLYNIVKI